MQARQLAANHVTVLSSPRRTGAGAQRSAPNSTAAAGSPFNPSASGTAAGSGGTDLCCADAAAMANNANRRVRFMTGTLVSDFVDEVAGGKRIADVRARRAPRRARTGSGILNGFLHADVGDGRD